MAQFPAGLRRGGEHEWVRPGEGGATARIGITAAAAADLGDVVRVELPTVGSEVVAGDACGEPESTSTALEVHSPLTGVASAVNEAAAAAPETICSSPYDEGWLFEVEPDEAQESGGPPGHAGPTRPQSATTGPLR